MWDKIIAFFDALLIHAFFLAILVLNFNFSAFFSSATLTEKPPNNFIDESAVQTELERLKRDDDFKTTAQRAQEYALQQKQLEYEYFVLNEKAHLQDLDKQQDDVRQELRDLKQRRLTAEKFLKELQSEKAKIQ
jgi:preprotein translocase subunit SecF